MAMGGSIFVQIRGIIAGQTNLNTIEKLKCLISIHGSVLYKKETKIKKGVTCPCNIYVKIFSLANTAGAFKASRCQQQNSGLNRYLSINCLAPGAANNFTGQSSKQGCISHIRSTDIVIQWTYNGHNMALPAETLVFLRQNRGTRERTPYSRQCNMGCTSYCLCNNAFYDEK